jgi:hypothetical protein
MVYGNFILKGKLCLFFPFPQLIATCCPSQYLKFCLQYTLFFSFAQVVVWTRKYPPVHPVIPGCNFINKSAGANHIQPLLEILDLSIK